MVERYYRLSSGQIELLKWIALVLMVVDHIGLFFDINPFRYIGRVVYPIFAFLAAYNYINNTSNKIGYIKRVCWWAVIAQLPYYLFVGTKTSSFDLNILFTLAIGLLVVYLAADCQKPWRWMAVALLIFLSLFVSYGVAGVSLVVSSYYLLKTQSSHKLKAGGEDLMASNANYAKWGALAFLVLVLAVLNHPKYLFATLMSVPIVYLISRSRIKIKRTNGKFFYAFYPAHIAVIGVIAYLLGAL